MRKEVKEIEEVKEVKDKIPARFVRSGKRIGVRRWVRGGALGRRFFRLASRSAWRRGRLKVGRAVWAAAALISWTRLRHGVRWDNCSEGRLRCSWARI